MDSQQFLPMILLHSGLRSLHPQVLIVPPLTFVFTPFKIEIAKNIYSFTLSLANSLRVHYAVGPWYKRDPGLVRHISSSP